jgi:diadenosine tetraphosphatase ApaH/serine/threonine PP2A family protein phosphatase
VRIALLSDIHSNWAALQAVLADLESGEPVDEIICLGDVVGYGPDPVRCLEHVRDRGWLTLVGNHDRACTDPAVLGWFNADAAAAIRWSAAQLDEGQLDWLRELPEQGERCGLQLVHGSPRDPVYEYILDSQTAAINLNMIGDAVCFHGHTHVPGVFDVEHGAIDHQYRHGAMAVTGPALVNPGSVGQPRDGDPDASYGVWDTDTSSFEFRRVPYDREAVKQAILEAGLPPRLAFRLDFGR